MMAGGIGSEPVSGEIVYAGKVVGQAVCKPEMLNNSALMVYRLFMAGFLIIQALLWPGHSIAGGPGNAGVASGGLAYQIGPWKGFKTAAMTFTFDDNYRFQVTLARPLLNVHNFKATYFWVTNRVGKGWAPGWDTAQMLAAEGHELASHSKNHPDFVALSHNAQWDSIHHELRDSRDTINARIPFSSCGNFAWPNGLCNDEVISVAKHYYMACRGSVNSYNWYDPEDFYNIYSQYIYQNTPLNAINQYVDDILTNHGWLVERWHGFSQLGDTNGYEPVPIEVFHAHVDYVASREKDLWITTMDSVVKYIRERDSSTLVMVDSTAYQMVLGLGNSLPDTLVRYHIPLSLKIRISKNFGTVSLVTQGQLSLPFTVTEDGSGDNWLGFDALPNDSLIIVHKIPVGINDKTGQEYQAYCSPNPCREKTLFCVGLPCSADAEIRFIDLLGRECIKLSCCLNPGMNRIGMDVSMLQPGYYTCFISLPGKQMKISILKIN